MGDGAVLHDAPVHEHMLRTANRALLGQRGDEAVQAQAAELAVDGDQVLAVTIQLVQPIRQARDRRHGEHLAAGADEREPNLGIAQRQLRDAA